MYRNMRGPVPSSFSDPFISLEGIGHPEAFPCLGPLSDTSKLLRSFRASDGTYSDTLELFTLLKLPCLAFHTRG